MDMFVEEANLTHNSRAAGVVLNNTNSCSNENVAASLWLVNMTNCSF